MNKSHPVLGGRDTVKVAIAQISSNFLDLDASVDRAVNAIGEAARNGADLVVFPEVWLAGYPFWSEGWDSQVPDWVAARVRFYDAALTIPGPQTEVLAGAARQAGVHVVMGCNELDGRPGVETIYNSLLFINREGRLIGRHRKLMPTFTERMFWGFGDGTDLAVFETDIGRIGGLICGENLMTTTRAAMIAQGEHIHIAVFPGSFKLHTGPRLQEPDHNEFFWGHFASRAHAMEGGCFVICACGYMDPDDIPSDFPYKGRMNIDWAHGGSSVWSPPGVPLAEPCFGARIVYADLHANMIKVMKAILDSIGHYARPDVLRLLVRRNDRWDDAGTPASQAPLVIERDRLARAAEFQDVDADIVTQEAHRLGAEVVRQRPAGAGSSRPRSAGKGK